MATRFKKVTTSLLAFAAALCLQLAFAASSAARARRQGPPPTPAAQWERYAFRGDEFSVELPSMPFVFHTRRHIGGSGRDSDSMRVFGLHADGVVFMIVSYDRPRRGESLEDFARYPWSGGRPPGKASDITLNGLKGKEYRDAKTGAVTSRVFRTDEGAYFVRAFAPAERQPLAERFLDSLTLSAGPPGREISEAAAATPAAVEPPPAANGPGRGENTHDAKDQPVPRPQAADDYDDPKRVFSTKEVTRKAVIVYMGPPGFTEEARLNNTTGVVRLKAVLASTGRVTNIRVVKGLPDGLTELAIYTVNHVLFFPAQKDGRNVSQNILFEYSFNVR